MGVQINGDTGNISATKADYSGNVTIGGTLTYEDVTNVDSIGLVTARNGIEVGARPGVAASISVDGNMIVSGISTFGDDITFTGASANMIFDKSDNALEFNDDAKATFGTGADTTFTHSGADFAITNSTGNLNILNNSAEAVQIRHGSETMIKAISDGAVELYHDDSKKLETASGGVTVTGTLAATAVTGDGSALTGLTAGITQYDIWRITSNLALQTSGTIISANWERADNATATYIGNGMSESSGVFTFPVTGKWEIRVDGCLNSNDGEMHYGQVDVMISSDSGSSYDRVSRALGGVASGGAYGNLSTTCLIDVTNASTFRCKFDALASNSNQSYLLGNTDFNYSEFIFKRIADT